MWKLDELMGNWRSSQLILVQRLGGRPSQVHYPSLPAALCGCFGECMDPTGARFTTFLAKEMEGSVETSQGGKKKGQS